MKGLDLGRGRNSSGKVEPHSPTPHRIVHRCGRLNSPLLPFFGHQRIDGSGNGFKGPGCRRRRDCSICCRVRRKCSDPGTNGLALCVSQLLFGRHVRIGIRGQMGKQRALGRVTRNDDRTIIASFERRLRSIQFETALLLDGAVAFDALNIEQRLNRGDPKQRSIPRDRDAGQRDSEGKPHHIPDERGAHGRNRVKIPPVDAAAQSMFTENSHQNHAIRRKDLEIDPISGGNPGSSHPCGRGNHAVHPKHSATPSRIEQFCGRNRLSFLKG